MSPLLLAVWLAAAPEASAEDPLAEAKRASERARAIDPSTATNASDLQRALDARARALSDTLREVEGALKRPGASHRAEAARIAGDSVAEMSVALERLGPVDGTPSRIARLQDEAMRHYVKCKSTAPEGDPLRATCGERYEALRGRFVGAAVNAESAARAGRVAWDELAACLARRPREAPAPAWIVVRFGEDGAPLPPVADPPAPTATEEQACLARNAAKLPAIPKGPALVRLPVVVSN